MTDLASQLQEQGYVVVEDVLGADILHRIQADYAQLLDELAARWYAEGVIPSTFSDLPFLQRAAQVISRLEDEQYRYFDIALVHGEQLSEETPVHLSSAVFDLLTYPHLLDQIEQFIGSEILVNPIQHARIKPPQHMQRSKRPNGLVTRTGWHQDMGVARPSADQTDMLTVWLAITNASEDNGCLCVVPGSHRAGLVTHCTHKGLMIPDSLIESSAAPVPVKAGGALFMHRLTKHASLPNTSDSIRWSFDLRYQPVGQPTGREEFPGFVARSRITPNSVITDYHQWAALWQNARTQLTQQAEVRKTHRWTGHEPVCA